MGDFGVSFGALLLTYFSLMGIQSGEESWLACDEKHNDIWLKAMARQLPAPSAAALWCLFHRVGAKPQV